MPGSRSVHRRRRIGGWRVLALGLVAAGWLAVSGSVLGHAELIASTPADGARVPPPSEVVATFSEAVVADGSSLEVRNAAGAAIARGGLDPSDPKHLTMRVSLPALEPGAYTVRWTTVAEDGHVERGTFTFTVVPASPSPSPAPSPSPSASASAGPTLEPSPAASPARSAAPSPSTGQSSGGSAGDASAVAVPIVAALAFAGLAAAWFLRRRGG